MDLDGERLAREQQFEQKRRIRVPLGSSFVPDLTDADAFLTCVTPRC
jgi:hypothetical protein